MKRSLVVATIALTALGVFMWWYTRPVVAGCTNIRARFVCDTNGNPRTLNVAGDVADVFSHFVSVQLKQSNDTIELSIVARKTLPWERMDRSFVTAVEIGNL